MAQFSFIDLFAGIGGFRLALQSVGGECIGFSEIAPDAIKTYCANFKESEDYNFGDITKLKELPEHDFMTAGVPCQSWSIAGKNLGFDDDRGQLWNDTLFLLNKVRPKAFIFENVKGLADPRNKEALDYILERIKQAGYHAEKFLLNAYDYGVPQTRVRIYIVGFREKKYFDRFVLPAPFPGQVRLSDVLDGGEATVKDEREEKKARWSLSCNEQGFNDYFLFNDLRNGETTIHSWDINRTTKREKQICYLLLVNRRKKDYGELDGNPLSLEHFQTLDPTIKKSELEALVEKKILKHVDYLFEIHGVDRPLTADENFVLTLHENNVLNFDKLKTNRELKKRKVNVQDTLNQLTGQGVIRCIEVRYDFKNTKISTGLEGVNRIFLPSSKIYPTLVASDTNDFVATRSVEAETIEDFREAFMERVYRPQNYRKITKSEACRIQGFPADYKLPPTRPRWMKLIGNSVAVPVIKILAKAVVETGVFGISTYTYTTKRVPASGQLSFLDMLDLFEGVNTEASMVCEDTLQYGRYRAPMYPTEFHEKFYIARGNVFDVESFWADGVAAFVKGGFNNISASYDEFKSTPHEGVHVAEYLYNNPGTTDPTPENVNDLVADALNSLVEKGAQTILMPPIDLKGVKPVEKDMLTTKALVAWLEKNGEKINRVIIADEQTA